MKKIVQTAGRTQLGEFARSSPTSTTTSSSEKYGAAMTCFHCATPQFGNNHFAHQPRNHRQFAEISLAVGKEQWNYPHGSGRNYYSHRLLRRLAKGMGCLQSSKGGMERRCERRRRQGCFPARDDIPYWRTQHRLRQILQRQQLSGTNIRQSDTFLQCYL